LTHTSRKLSPDPDLHGTKHIHLVCTARGLQTPRSPHIVVSPVATGAFGSDTIVQLAVAGTPFSLAPVLLTGTLSPNVRAAAFQGPGGGGPPPQAAAPAAVPGGGG